MKIKSLNYRQHRGEKREWMLDEIGIGQINLVVGRNTTGKSRFVSIINGLADMISGRRPIPATGEYDVNFTSDEEDYRYQICYNEGEITLEKFENLTKKTLYLDRSAGGRGEIYMQQLNRLMEFQAPASAVAVNVRQDSVQHPFFEPLLAWANSTFLISFGTKLGQDRLAAFISGGRTPDIRDLDALVALVRRETKGQDGIDIIEQIKSDLSQIGYNLSDISVKPPQAFKVEGLPDVGALSVFDDDIGIEIDQTEISQGMFRTIAAVFYVNLWLREKTDCLVLVDDIGEGLDFERSTRLIHLLIGKFSKINAQIILTTNDRFIMNEVPLEHWIVLVRIGSHVSGYSYKNKREIFEDFRFTGLSNFDLLSTRFIESELQKSDE